MKNCFGQHGWKEFNQNRKDILFELDRIIEKTQNRPIQVAHGQGVEAFIRKWLSEFLPKKFGITSGYIIPDLYNDSLKLYHFDIIIYNQLEAPILWTEGNFDQNEQGKYRAIPAKHVVSVYEVKSRLTKPNITEALKKLGQTEGFVNQLNPLYSCGIIFIDLKETENNNKSIVKELIKGKDVFGFSGGVILRYEKDHSCVGRIKLFDINKEEKIENQHLHLAPIAKPIESLNIYITEDGNLQIAEQGAGAKIMVTSPSNWSVSKIYGVEYSEGHKLINIGWSRSYFSDFCIDLISTLEGLVFNDKERPSFGQVFDGIERKKAPLQGENIEKNKPYIILKLYEGGEYGEKLIIDSEFIKFKLLLENIGEADAIISDDSFKNKQKLPTGKKAIKEITFQAKPKHSNKQIREILVNEPLEIPYRMVYYSDNINKEFIAIETKLKIFKNEINIVE